VNVAYLYYVNSANNGYDYVDDICAHLTHIPRFRYLHYVYVTLDIPAVFSIHGNRLSTSPMDCTLTHSYFPTWFFVFFLRQSFWCIFFCAARYVLDSMWKAAINLPLLEFVAGEQTCRGLVRGSTRRPQSHLLAGSALGRAPCEYFSRCSQNDISIFIFHYYLNL